MACPGCAQDLQVGRNFCGTCGAPLVPPCPTCGHHLSLGDRYCSQCGSLQPATLTSNGAAADGPGGAARHYPEGLFGYVLVGLVVRLAIYPLFSADVGMRVLLDAALLLGLLYVVMLIDSRRPLYRAMSIVAVVLVAVDGLSYFVANDAVSIILRVLMLGFLSSACLVILRAVLRSEHITLDKVYGAVCAYLLIAFTWGYAYDLLNIVQPGSFQIPELKDATGNVAGRKAELTELIYFSFMTITSVGYTDIIVGTDNARTLLLVESVLGQIYPVVLISRLVNLQVTHALAFPMAPRAAPPGRTALPRAWQRWAAPAIRRMRRVAER